jgi:hypothetical protein
MAQTTARASVSAGAGGISAKMVTELKAEVDVGDDMRDDQTNRNSLEGLGKKRCRVRDDRGADDQRRQPTPLLRPRKTQEIPCRIG